MNGRITPEEYRQIADKSAGLDNVPLFDLGEFGNPDKAENGDPDVDER